MMKDRSATNQRLANRRRLLKALGTLGVTGLAGCVRDSGGGATPTPTAMPTPTSRLIPGRAPISGVSLFSIPFEFEIEIETASPTADHPPVIRGSIENTDSEPHILSTVTGPFPFPGLTGYTCIENSLTSASYVADGAIGRNQVDEAFKNEERGTCWSGAPGAFGSVDGREFAPGESLPVQLVILNVSDKCWPEETAYFFQEYDFDSPDPMSMGGEGFAWGFRVRMDETGIVDLTEIPPHQPPDPSVFCPETATQSSDTESPPALTDSSPPF